MILVICMCLKEGRALDSCCNGLETLQQILHLTAIHGLRNLKILNFQVSNLIFVFMIGEDQILDHTSYILWFNCRFSQNILKIYQNCFAASMYECVLSYVHENFGAHTYLLKLKLTSACSLFHHQLFLQSVARKAPGCLSKFLCFQQLLVVIRSL